MVNIRCHLITAHNELEIDGLANLTFSLVAASQWAAATRGYYYVSPLTKRVSFRSSRIKRSMQSVEFDGEFEMNVVGESQLNPDGNAVRCVCADCFSGRQNTRSILHA